MSVPTYTVASATESPVPTNVILGTLLAIPATLPPWAGGGGAGGSGFQHNQVGAGATWTIPHSIGRIPSVQVYIAGKAVLADVEATSSQVVITFASPQSGVAILT